MTERTTVRLPDDLLNRAKRKVVAEGRTLTSLLEEGLRLIVSGSRRPVRGRRVLPPISTASGGLMPGVDAIRLSGIEEAEDIEAVERMKRSK